LIHPQPNLSPLPICRPRSQNLADRDERGYGRGGRGSRPQCDRGIPVPAPGNLAETKGRFRLNEPLAIAFDTSGTLEVGLVCTEARLAIELYSARHLADADAHRRDRRKDRLLQENGYFVLRFLAEDVGKDLDRKLDAVLSALGRRS
jgi:hypothetical protein